MVPFQVISATDPLSPVIIASRASSLSLMFLTKQKKINWKKRDPRLIAKVMFGSKAGGVIDLNGSPSSL